MIAETIRLLHAALPQENTAAQLGGAQGSVGITSTSSFEHVQGGVAKGWNSISRNLAKRLSVVTHSSEPHIIG